VSGSGADVIAVAEQHLGTPYVLSPPGPCSAFEAEDCSCFTMLVFQEFGIALPDSPGAQMGYGTPVSGAPQAGDLLFWSEDGSGTITHVGIAMGDGTTIHASNYAGEVAITSINYINGYVGARRLL
jgi:cell wall-associated NlpC family hydrolase